MGGRIKGCSTHLYNKGWSCSEADIRCVFAMCEYTWLSLDRAFFFRELFVLWFGPLFTLFGHLLCDLCDLNAGVSFLIASLYVCGKRTFWSVYVIFLLGAKSTRNQWIKRNKYAIKWSALSPKPTPLKKKIFNLNVKFFILVYVRKSFNLI